MKGLTEQQRAVLAFVRRTLRQRGVTPTLREIAAAMGWSSTNAVAVHLRALEAKGYVRRLHRRGRGLVLLREPKPRADRHERIAQIREQIAVLEAELARLLEGDVADPSRYPGKAGQRDVAEERKLSK